MMALKSISGINAFVNSAPSISSPLPIFLSPSFNQQARSGSHSFTSTALALEKSPSWEEEHRSRVEACYSARDDNFYSVLESRGYAKFPFVMGKAVNPYFMGGAKWPNLRQSITACHHNERKSVMMTTDGMSDPFDEPDAPTNGFGYEFMMEATGDLPVAWQYSTPAQLLDGISQTMANYGPNFLPWFLEERVMSLSHPWPKSPLNHFPTEMLRPLPPEQWPYSDAPDGMWSISVLIFLADERCPWLEDVNRIQLGDKDTDTSHLICIRPIRAEQLDYILEGTDEHEPRVKRLEILEEWAQDGSWHTTDISSWPVGTNP